MIKVYGFPNSRSLRVVWALEEVGLNYDYVKIDLAKGEGRQPGYLAVNPTGKVPALVDGATVIAESAAIVTYIAEQNPHAGLIPPLSDAKARAEYFQWSFFALTELEQPLWTLAKHRFTLPESKRVPAIEATALWEFGVAAKLLAQHLAGRFYVAGDSFTGADIFTAQTLAWARAWKIPFGSDVLESYADRILGRPAVAAAKAREAA